MLLILTRRKQFFSVCMEFRLTSSCVIVAPNRPADRSYADLVKLDHHHPQPSETVQRFQFHTAILKEGQTFASFLAHLLHLSEHCDFGDIHLATCSLTEMTSYNDCCWPSLPLSVLKILKRQQWHSSQRQEYPD